MALGNYIRSISEKTNNELSQYFEMYNATVLAETWEYLEELLTRYGDINRKWVELIETRVNTIRQYLESADISIRFIRSKTIYGFDYFLKN